VKFLESKKEGVFLSVLLLGILINDFNNRLFLVEIEKIYAQDLKCNFKNINIKLK
jgi:hypothetical protein